MVSTYFEGLLHRVIGNTSGILLNYHWGRILGTRVFVLVEVPVTG